MLSREIRTAQTRNLKRWILVQRAIVFDRCLRIFLVFKVLNPQRLLKVLLVALMDIWIVLRHLKLLDPELLKLGVLRIPASVLNGPSQALVHGWRRHFLFFPGCGSRLCFALLGLDHRRLAERLAIGILRFPLRGLVVSETSIIEWLLVRKLLSLLRSVKAAAILIETALLLSLKSRRGHFGP